VLTLVNFVAALIVSWVVVYAVYGLTLLAVRSVWLTVRVVTAHAGAGAALVVVHPVRWMVRRVARLGRACIQSSHADSVVAPAVPSTPARRPTFPDVAVSIREATCISFV
jgi:hypothetical protein